MPLDGQQYRKQCNFFGATNISVKNKLESLSMQFRTTNATKECTCDTSATP